VECLGLAAFFTDVYWGVGCCIVMVIILKNSGGRRVSLFVASSYGRASHLFDHQLEATNVIPPLSSPDETYAMVMANRDVKTEKMMSWTTLRKKPNRMPVMIPWLVSSDS